MNKILIIALSVLLWQISSAQTDSAKFYVDQGIEMHDKGNYEEAIRSYDNAIRIDKNNFDALYEKSFTFFHIKEYDQCIALSKYLIKNFSSNSNLKGVYVNYGSSLDDQGKSKEALTVYSEGLKAFPKFYLLWFNNGLTLYRMNNVEEASTSFETALKFNPLHASSNNMLAYIQESRNRIASLLANTTFLLLEQQGDRVKTAVEREDKLLNGNISKGNNCAVTINISPEALDTKKKENNFSTVELTLSLLGSMPGKDPNKNNAADKLDSQLDMMGSILSESKKNKGFYWEHYAPFFVDIKNKKFTEVVAHLCYSSKNDRASNEWLEINKQKVEEFYIWLKSYEWKS